MNDKILDTIINGAINNYSRENTEPFKSIFPDAEKLSKKKWIYDTEEVALDIHPIKASIIPGEYGNCILAIYANDAETEIYLQWTYSHKGSLYTDYYKVAIDN